MFFKDTYCGNHFPGARIGVCRVSYRRSSCVWMLTLSYRATVCDFFMNGRSFFLFLPLVSTRIEFHFIEKNKGGVVGEGRGWSKKMGGGSEDRPPPLRKFT